MFIWTSQLTGLADASDGDLIATDPATSIAAMPATSTNRSARVRNLRLP